MLDVTTNQASTNISNSAYCGYGIADEAAAAAEFLLDDQMMTDPLFEEDWLHENNLDILFDLFEEEIESKIGVDSNNGSSTLFGTSPVTSYLFGTSPSLASALDLIYFDNQSSNTNSNVSAPTLAASSPSSTTTAATNINLVAPVYQTTSNIKSNGTQKVAHKTKVPSHNSDSNGAQQINNLANSITNAMRIKRGLKKGQSEGVSLLAKPSLSNSSAKTYGNSGTSSNINCNNSKNASKVNYKKINCISNKNNSDKNSVKITNFKSSIIVGNKNNRIIRNGIDINYSKQNQQPNRERYYIHKCQQHVHCITGRAVIHEHAYAIRGH